MSPYLHYIAADAGSPPDDWPHYGIKFVPAVKRALRKYAVFSGRAGQGEYWWWVLFVLAGWLVLGLFAALFGRLTSPDGGLSDGWGTWPFFILFVVFWLGALVPTFAVSVRRLHDAGFSGWFYLLAFVPFASIVPVIMLFMPPSAKGAQYGPPGPRVAGPAGGFPSYPVAPGSAPGQPAAPRSMDGAAGGGYDSGYVNPQDSHAAPWEGSAVQAGLRRRSRDRQALEES